MARKLTGNAKGRTANRSARCYCGGSGSRAGHALTAQHRSWERQRHAAVETSGPADIRGHVFRDPYGDRRDWDAEARQYVELSRAEYEVELHTLIERGPLPEPPTVDYPNGVALITIAEAAKRLNRQPVTLRMAIHRGRMVGHKLGRDWLVEESEVAWYEATRLGRVGWPKGRSRKTA